MVGGVVAALHAGIDDAAKNQNHAGQIQPQHQHDDAAYAAISGGVIAKMTDIEREAIGQRQPASAGDDCARQDAFDVQAWLGFGHDPVNQQQQGENQYRRQQPAYQIPHQTNGIGNVDIAADKLQNRAAKNWQQ